MTSTESKVVPLDEAVKQISSTVNSHSDSLRRLDEMGNTIQSNLDTQIALLRTDTHKDLQALETRLISALDEKHTIWTHVSEEIQSLKTDLLDLKTLLTPQRATSSPTHDRHPFNIPSASPLHSPPPQSPPLNGSDSHQLVSRPSILASPHTIVLPPTSSLPTFSGRPTERPRQFLIRVEEFTRTVNHWSSDTLLTGISQYLKDDALEWYCQLSRADNLPATWHAFVSRFLAQFHSPIRAAQQEQAWTECRQQENETINQFVVRLRSIWLEQKPDETDSHFKKHLFCKMRPDMLSLMNFSRSSSLAMIILEAQKVEEILFLRNKEQRQRDLKRSKLTLNTNYLSLSPTPYNAPSPLPTTHASPLMDVTPRSRPSAPAPQRSFPTQSQSSRTNITCWRCYETGHYSTECPLNDDRPSPNYSSTNTYDNSSSRPSQHRSDNVYQPLPPRPKNT